MNFFDKCIQPPDLTGNSSHLASDPLRRRCGGAHHEVRLVQRQRPKQKAMGKYRKMLCK